MACTALPLWATPVEVRDLADLQHHMARAAPGTEVVLQPGVYRLNKSLRATAHGTPTQVIVLRGAAPNAVWLEVNTEVGIQVSAPHWVFKQLGMRGVCQDHSRCEHAFHVVGHAHHTTIQNTDLQDFNAHIKVNGVNGVWPDHGRVVASNLSNASARVTAQSVTPVDIVGASGWVVANNRISGFAKQGGNGVAYGAFMKGGGSGGRFEGNHVTCNPTPQPLPGQQVGLSFGGGGTGQTYCRDLACAVEHKNGVMQDNRISACSDVGIYLNRSPHTTLDNNTLVNTKGVQVRER